MHRRAYTRHISGSEVNRPTKGNFEPWQRYILLARDTDLPDSALDSS